MYQSHRRTFRKIEGPSKGRLSETSDKRRDEFALSLDQVRCDGMIFEITSCASASVGSWFLPRVVSTRPPSPTTSLLANHATNIITSRKFLRIIFLARISLRASCITLCRPAHSMTTARVCIGDRIGHRTQAWFCSFIHSLLSLKIRWARSRLVPAAY
jgi:hypothetical protein